jgi:glycosyltransferase involved in cell wall biosynthesis
MTPWMLAAGDVVPIGGMDTANFGLASFLARQGAELHLVAHRVAEELAMANVHHHRVPRPLGWHRLGGPLLTQTASRWARRVRQQGGHVIANGGNFVSDDLNWVHYVHAAYVPHAEGAVNSRLVRASHRGYLAAEMRALRDARLVVCNSVRTVEDVVLRVGVERARTRLVYYGTDPARFAPPRDAAAAKAAIGIDPNRACALFVGALGDRRKGFDVLFGAWQQLCRAPVWDVDLVVAGSGAELKRWRARTLADPNVSGRIRFLGYVTDMPAIFAAADVLVHPARYEAYGLAVHEALCCSVPAIVSAHAGVAEQYTNELRPLLLDDVESPSELAGRLRTWHAQRRTFHRHAAALGAALRGRTWDDMAREIVALADA